MLVRKLKQLKYKFFIARDGEQEKGGLKKEKDFWFQPKPELKRIKRAGDDVDPQ